MKGINQAKVEAYAQQLRRDLAQLPGTLPLLQDSAAAALELAQKANIEFDEITALAESDPALAARFLSTANSALYFRGTRVSSLRSAVVRLGVQEARDVLFMAVYSNVMLKIPRYRALVDGVFWHSVLVARTARTLAQRLGQSGDLAFMAGLMHDVGWAYCLKLASRRYPASVAHSKDLLQAVRDLHAAAGASLATTWRLSKEVVDACEHHHAAIIEPVGVEEADIRLSDLTLAELDAEIAPITKVVAVANATTRRLERPPPLTLEELTPLLAQLGPTVVEISDSILGALQEEQRQANPLARAGS
ncbi:MAG: HDOD domain-containing protein [Polyangiales bacterium]